MSIFNKRRGNIGSQRGPHTPTSQDFEEVVALKRTQSSCPLPPMAVAKAATLLTQFFFFFFVPLPDLPLELTFQQKNPIVKTPLFWKRRAKSLDHRRVGKLLNLKNIGKTQQRASVGDDPTLLRLKCVCNLT